MVRDPEQRAKAVGGAREAVGEGGFEVIAECDSAVPGPKGNVEAFLYARRIERPGAGAHV